MTRGPAIALIDGDHHPDAVRAALARVEAERSLVAVVFCGGEEKLPPGRLEDVYGRAMRTDPEAALRELAADAESVLDLADEPVLPVRAKLRLAALALHLGLAFESPGMVLNLDRARTRKGIADRCGVSQERPRGGRRESRQLAAVAVYASRRWTRSMICLLGYQDSSIF